MRRIPLARAGPIGNQPRERRLADTRRTPQDQRTGVAALDAAAQGAGHSGYTAIGWERFFTLTDIPFSVQLIDDFTQVARQGWRGSYTGSRTAR